MARTSSLALSAVVIFGAVACGDRSPPDAEKVSAHMQDHFTKIGDLQLAVVNGDLDAAKQPARWLAEHATLSGMPDSWQPYLPAMREAAQVAAGATDMLTVSKATAQLGAACGKCHAALGAKVAFDIESALPEGGDAAAHMKRHAWASGRLWEGLVVPSGQVWQTGAAALDEVPLVPEEVTSDPEKVPEVKALSNRVHELGAAARQAGDPETRAAVYGDFLDTCARCHAALGLGAI